MRSPARRCAATAGEPGARQPVRRRRSTTGASGIATTISSPTCSRRTRIARTPERAARLPPAGERVVRAPRLRSATRSATRSPPRTSGARRRSSRRAGPSMDSELPDRDAGSTGVTALPDDGAAASGPCSSMGYAWALLNVGELEAAEARLRDVERWLAGTTRSSESTEHRGRRDGRRRRGAIPVAAADESRVRPRLPRARAAARCPGPSSTRGGRSTSCPRTTTLDARRRTALVWRSRYGRSGELEAALRHLRRRARAS